MWLRIGSLFPTRPIHLIPFKHEPFKGSLKRFQAIYPFANRMCRACCQARCACRSTSGRGMVVSGWPMTIIPCSGMPKARACDSPATRNPSVQIVAAGVPSFSKETPSCTLHVVQEPQAPAAVMTTSHSRCSSASRSPEALAAKCSLARCITPRG